MTRKSLTVVICDRHKNDPAYLVGDRLLCLCEVRK